MKKHLEGWKAKKCGLMETRVYMGIFDYSVICVIGSSNKLNEYIAWKFDEKYVDHEDMNNYPSARGICFYKHNYVPIIWIPTVPKTPRDYASLSHECLHAVFHLFDWAHLPITRDTEEVMTHSMAHLITEIIKFAKR